MSSGTIYVGTAIHTPTRDKLDIRHNVAIGVDAGGKISFIDNLSSPDEDISSIASKHSWKDYDTVRTPTAKARSFFFPGLIDTHTHASQYPNVGIFGSSTLLSWLETYTFPLESSYDNLQLAQRIYSRVVRRSLSYGTTCAAYYATRHVDATNLLADTCLAQGQRALIGRVCMDRRVPDSCRDESVEEAVKATRECIAHCNKIDPQGKLIRSVITPRFAPTCSNKCLEAMGQLHRDSGCFVQTHISENGAEIELVKELFPESKSYADVYDEAGLLSDKTILAHAVHLNEREVGIVKGRGTGLAHCPTSNTSLTSGAAKVRRMMDDGVKIGLGTDVSGGYSLSVLEVARQAMGVSRHVAMESGNEQDKLSVVEALYLATLGGANVVGLGHEVGSFEVGKEWDAQLICLDLVQGQDEEVGRGPVDIFGWESWEDTVAKWLYGGDDRNIGGIWVKGNLVQTKLDR